MNLFVQFVESTEAWFVSLTTGAQVSLVVALGYTFVAIMVGLLCLLGSELDRAGEDEEQDSWLRGKLRALFRIKFFT